MVGAGPDVFIMGGDRVLHAGTYEKRSLRDQTIAPTPAPTGGIAGDLGAPFPDGKPRASRWWVVDREQQSQASLVAAASLEASPNRPGLQASPV